MDVINSESKYAVVSNIDLSSLNAFFCNATSFLLTTPSWPHFTNTFIAIQLTFGILTPYTTEFKDCYKSDLSADDTWRHNLLRLIERIKRLNQKRNEQTTAATLLSACWQISSLELGNETFETRIELECQK